MRNFSELAKIVTSHKSKKIDLLFDESSSHDTKYQKVALLLVENPNLEDEEAEAIIGANRASSSFRMFRKRFKEKLLNSLLISDVEPKTNYSKAFASLSRNEFCIRLLLNISARSSGVELAEQTLKKATEFQINDIALYCSRVLREHQRHLGNLTEFEYYRNLSAHYRDLQNAEMQCSELYDELTLHYTNTGTFKEETAPRFSDNSKIILELKNKYNSYLICLFYFRYNGILSFVSQNYVDALSYWDQAISYVDIFKHFEYETRLGEFLMQKMNIFLYMHDYSQGLKCAEQCSTIYKPGHHNWFTYNELFLILALHTQNYAQAGKILEQVSGISQFKFQAENVKERWRIFEAYYFILLKAGVAERTANIKFRFSTFLNSITIHSKDKKGYNASILIAEMMYHILNKEFHIVTEKMDALKRYSKRHFEDSDNYRSDIFIRILIECEKNKFEKAPVLQKTKKLVDKLQEIQFSYISSLDGIEIVPFIDLWKIVLNCLD